MAITQVYNMIIVETIISQSIDTNRDDVMDGLRDFEMVEKEQVDGWMAARVLVGDGEGWCGFKECTPSNDET